MKIEKNDITFTLTDSDLKAFQLAIEMLETDADKEFHSFVRRLVYSSIKKYQLEEKEPVIIEHSEKEDLIYRWAYKPDSIIYKIISTYLFLKEDNIYITKEQMIYKFKELYNGEKSVFLNNFRLLCSNAEKAYGMIFILDRITSNISLSVDVEPLIKSLKNEFTKTINISIKNRSLNYDDINKRIAAFNYHHLLIRGNTGSGKSNFIKWLVDDLKEDRSRTIIIIDTKQIDYIDYVNIHPNIQVINNIENVPNILRNINDKEETFIIFDEINEIINNDESTILIEEIIVENNPLIHLILSGQINNYLFNMMKKREDTIKIAFKMISETDNIEFIGKHEEEILQKPGDALIKYPNRYRLDKTHFPNVNK